MRELTKIRKTLERIADQLDQTPKTPDISETIKEKAEALDLIVALADDPRWTEEGVCINCVKKCIEHLANKNSGMNSGSSHLLRSCFDARSNNSDEKL